MCRNFVMIEEEIGWALDDVEDLDDLRSNIPWFSVKAIYSKPFLPLASQTYQTSLQQMEHNRGGSGKYTPRLDQAGVSHGFLFIRGYRTSYQLVRN